MKLLSRKGQASRGFTQSYGIYYKEAIDGTKHNLIRKIKIQGIRVYNVKDGMGLIHEFIFKLGDSYFILISRKTSFWHFQWIFGENIERILSN
ncbi:hypothetical protein P8452_65313 [Trifolium repens]|nr:hypothetical protein P8452_65313 [Trifolium repens]